MTSAAKQILQDALALSNDAREELVTALAESLEPPALSPEWQSEIRGRVERLANGDANVLDAEEHLRGLRAKYG